MPRPPQHLIHKSSAEIKYQLELVNGKLDQLLKSDVLKEGLAAIVTELVHIKEEIEDCCDCWDNKRNGDGYEVSLADIGAATATGKAFASAGIVTLEDLAGKSGQSPQTVAGSWHKKLRGAFKGSKTKKPSKDQILKMVKEAREKLKPA